VASVEGIEFNFMILLHLYSSTKSIITILGIIAFSFPADEWDEAFMLDGSDSAPNSTAWCWTSLCWRRIAFSSFLVTVQPT
jgi:hypothetical protein